MPITRPEIANVNLGTIAGGSLPDAFLEQWDKVMRSIADRRTKPGAVRKVTIEIAVVADDDREEFQVAATCEAKLPKVVVGQSSGYLIESLDRLTYEAQEVRRPKQEQLPLPGDEEANKAAPEVDDGPSELPEADEEAPTRRIGGGNIHHIRREA